MQNVPFFILSHITATGKFCKLHSFFSVLKTQYICPKLAPLVLISHRTDETIINLQYNLA